MIRKAEKEDLPALAELEKEAFGDSDAFCRLVFESFAGLGHIWLDEQDGAPVCMALAVPCSIAGVPGAYLYALATRRARRGQGLMSAMLERLKQEGRACGWGFLCLVPADEKLADYYKARGFETAFYRQQYSVPIRRDLLAVAEFDDITVAMLPQLRADLCRAPAVELGHGSLAAMLTDYYSAGGCTVRTQDAYGFFRVRSPLVRSTSLQDASAQGASAQGGTLLFDEFFARDEQSANELLQACREKTGCTEASILTDDGNLTCYGSGHRLPYGMWCLLGPAPARQAYLGMMLEQ